MKIIIRKAGPEEYLAVADIGRRTFYETWRPMHSEQDMQIYMAESFDDLKIKHDLENTDNSFLLAETNGEIIGYVKLRTDRSYPELKGSSAIEMERIYVLKEHQDMKAGRALMQESIRIAKERTFEWLWLGVNADNLKAINFYVRFGFVKFGIKTFKLGNIIDNDDLMKLKL